MSPCEEKCVVSGAAARLLLAVTLTFGAVTAALAVGPTITYTSPNPVLYEGSSILLGADATITDPDSTTLSKIDIIGGGDGFPLILANDPVTMGSIRLRWTSYIFTYAYLYRLSPDPGPLPTMTQWQNALRGLRMGLSGGVSIPDGGVSISMYPYDDGNTVGNGGRAIGLRPTVLTVPPGTLAMAVNEALTFTGANAISFPDLGDFSSPEYADRQRVTVSVSHGTVSVANTAGVSFIAPNGSSAPEFEGASSGMRAALEGMVYTPAANYEGGDLLVVTLGGRFIHPQGQVSVVAIDSQEVPLRVGMTPVTLQSFDVD